MTREEISGGHAFQEPVLDGAGFPGIAARQQFASDIEDVVLNGETRALTGGRTGYWQDGMVPAGQQSRTRVATLHAAWTSGGDASARIIAATPIRDMVKKAESSSRSAAGLRSPARWALSIA